VRRDQVMEGNCGCWLTDELTTVTVHCQEIGLHPAAGSGFRRACGHVLRLGRVLTTLPWVLLVVVALVPWLPVIALVALPTWLVVRRVNRPRVAG
jgi:hypothetical protein